MICPGDKVQCLISTRRLAPRGHQQKLACAVLLALDCGACREHLRLPCDGHRRYNQYVFSTSSCLFPDSPQSCIEAKCRCSILICDHRVLSIAASSLTCFFSAWKRNFEAFLLSNLPAIPFFFLIPPINTSLQSPSSLNIPPFIQSFFSPSPSPPSPLLNPLPTDPPHNTIPQPALRTEHS